MKEVDDMFTPDAHPVLACARSVRAALADVADLDPTFMPSRDKAAALLAISEALAAANALQARLLASSHEIALETGARDVANWLASIAHGDYVSLRRTMELGRRLECAALVSEAFSGGRIDAQKAGIILRTLEELPEDTPQLLRDQAEAELVRQAPDFSPKALARLARHIEAVIDPDTADEAEGRALLREERSAWDKTMLRIMPRFDGTTRISGVLPEAAAHRLRTYLEAFTQPRKLEGEVVRADQRMGRAFCELVERIDPARLPRHGGDATTVMITVPLADMRAELGAAAIGGLDSEAGLSAAEVRRLACTADIIPAVLGSQSQILDLGRTQRLFSPTQRKALRTRHSTCQVEGCDVPSAWCDAHHDDPWSTGGKTDLKNALLVCGHRHRRLHDSRYASARSGDQIIVRLRR